MNNLNHKYNINDTVRYKGDIYRIYAQYNKVEIFHNNNKLTTILYKIMTLHPDETGSHLCISNVLEKEIDQQSVSICFTFGEEVVEIN